MVYFDTLISFLTTNKFYLLYAIILIAAVVLLYIYTKKFFFIMGENDTTVLRDDFQQLRHDLNRLKDNSRQLNLKVNDINTRVKYGQISKQNNEQLPFTMECLEATPFYNAIGSQLLGAVGIGETPTDRPDYQVEEMSEPNFEISEEESDKHSDKHSDSEERESFDLPDESLASHDLVLSQNNMIKEPTLTPMLSNIKDNSKEINLVPCSGTSLTLGKKNKLSLSKKARISSVGEQCS